MIKKATEVLNEMYMEKEARTRVQKMVDSGEIQKKIDMGKLPSDILERLRTRKPVQTTDSNDKAKHREYLHNKINAKGIREKEGLISYKNPITVARYRGISKVDNLQSKPMIVDSKQQLRGMGHYNAKIIAKLRKITGSTKDNPKVSFPELTGEVLDAHSSFDFDPVDYRISQAKFKLPGASAKLPGEAPLVSKELRGHARAHDMSSEPRRLQKILTALKAAKIEPTDANVNSFIIASHNDPGVLIDDAKNIKRLSSRAQEIFARKNAIASSGVSTSTTDGKVKQLNENEIMNVVRDSDISKGKIISSDKKYFKRQDPNKEEFNAIMKNTAILNKMRGRHNLSEDQINTLIQEYNKAKL